MKKKSNKKNVKIPAYAFGIDQLSNYLGGTGVLGSAIAGLSNEGTTGDIVGSTLGSTASLAGAGFKVGGPIGAIAGGLFGLGSGLIGAFKRKKQLADLKRRQETVTESQLGLGRAASAEDEFYAKNPVAYSYENGGILPDLAYLDNNEIVRDDYGNISKVPNTKPGTDNHLIDASNLDSVLSDKIKRPGTNKTFAQEGKKLTRMTKSSKGKDKFAENTNRLNKINANKAYNKLLAEQEVVKAAKGVKPKVKGIPAYADGKGKTVDDVRSKMNADTYAAYSDFFDELGTGLNKFGEALGYFPKRIFGPLINNKNITKAVESARDTKPSATSMDYTGDTNISKVFNRSISMNPLSIGSPTTGAWFSYPTQMIDAITYANDEPISVDIPLRPIESEPTATNTYTNTSNKQVTRTPSTKDAPKTTITPQDADNLLPTKKPRVNTSMKLDWGNTVKGIDPKKANEIYKERQKYYQNLADEESDSYSPDWLSLAPTVYNTLQSLRGPEEEPLVLNPYAGAVRSTMARRRMNIEPAIEANRRARAISNYNLTNMNTNTGANLAARTQAAVNEYASNADMYANKSNVDNAYLGEYANMLNNLGQQFEQSTVRYHDLNARNRTAARNFGATATSQLGKWSQVNRQMHNQYNRDMAVLPFLTSFLGEGFTKEQVQNLYNTVKSKV